MLLYINRVISWLNSRPLPLENKSIVQPQVVETETETVPLVFICNNNRTIPVFTETLPIGPNQQPYCDVILEKTKMMPTWTKPINVGGQWQLRYLV